MKKIISIIFSLTFVFLFWGCSNSTDSPTENDNDLEVEISGSTSFKYEYLSKAPIHTQSSMLTGYKNKLYRFGSRWPVQILDLSTNSWSQIQLPDSSYNRWDGAAVTVGDMIYVIAVSVEPHSYDIFKLDPATSNFEHTGVNLPLKFRYPAYCLYGENIIFCSRGIDSVYEYNTINNELKKVVNNPFFTGSDPGMSLSSGHYQNYFYVFGVNLFYRLNLDNYSWENLKLPSVLKDKYLFGASFSDSFVLFEDTLSTYEYSFTNNKWYEAVESVPIYPTSLQGTPILYSEWSFFSDDSSLFATEISNDMVWKISK